MKHAAATKFRTQLYWGEILILLSLYHFVLVSAQYQRFIKRRKLSDSVPVSSCRSIYRALVTLTLTWCNHQWGLRTCSCSYVRPLNNPDVLILVHPSVHSLTHLTTDYLWNASNHSALHQMSLSFPLTALIFTLNVSCAADAPPPVCFCMISVVSVSIFLQQTELNGDPAA